LKKDEWVRLENRELPNCKVFVSPDSYLLMTPIEREARWSEDVEKENYPASLWIEAMRHKK